MSESPILIVDTDPELEWIEISRNEALQRIENMLTEDLVAFEVDVTHDDIPVGRLATYTWLRVTDDDDQLPALLAVRYPGTPDAGLRWFVHADLIGD